MGSGKRKMIAKMRHKDRKRQAGRCSSKTAYEFAEAQLYGIRYAQSAYKCSVCQRWHLTSKRERKA